MTTDMTTAAVLFPTMQGVVHAAYPVHPDAAVASELFPSMHQPPVPAPVPAAQPAPAVAAPEPASAPPATPDPAHALTMPETHYAPAEQFAAWESEILASPLAASLPMARDVLQAHAPPGLVTMLAESGYGSHPDVVRFVVDLASRIPQATGDAP